MFLESSGEKSNLIDGTLHSKLWKPMGSVSWWQRRNKIFPEQWSGLGYSWGMILSGWGEKRSCEKGEQEEAAPVRPAWAAELSLGWNPAQRCWASREGESVEATEWDEEYERAEVVPCCKTQRTLEFLRMTPSWCPPTQKQGGEIWAACSKPGLTSSWSDRNGA